MRSDGTHEGFKLEEAGFLKNGQGSPVAEHWGRECLGLPSLDLLSHKGASNAQGRSTLGPRLEPSGCAHPLTSLDPQLSSLSFSSEQLQPPASSNPSGTLRASWAKAAKSQWGSRPCFHTYSDRACAASRTSPCHLFRALFEIIFFIRLK